MARFQQLWKIEKVSRVPLSLSSDVPGRHHSIYPLAMMHAENEAVRWRSTSSLLTMNLAVPSCSVQLSQFKFKWLEYTSPPRSYRILSTMTVRFNWLKLLRISPSHQRRERHHSDGLSFSWEVRFLMKSILSFSSSTKGVRDVSRHHDSRAQWSKRTGCLLKPTKR